jgi:CRISPR-associated endonuclease/helicase Cas3
MRGWERDGLVRDATFSVFLKKERPAERHWLVATSAGEVGVDLTSDLLITDLETADHLIQRFGRLNRFGETEGVAHLLYAAAFDAKQERERRTLEYFTGLPGSADTGYDISCRCLHDNRAPEGSLSEEPLQARLDSRLIDLWSQTSAGQSPAVPPVADWLHGKQDDEWPETQIAWRAEVELFAGKDVDEQEIENALDHYPVLARERLKEPTTRVMEKLAKLPQDEPAVLIMPDGTVKRGRAGELADRPNDLAYATVLLRPGCGGIIRGMFQPSESGSGLYDVADIEEEGDRSRYVAVSSDGGRALTKLGAAGAAMPTESIEAFARDRGMKEVARVRIPSGESGEDLESKTCLVYLRKVEKKKNLEREIRLSAHSASVAKMAREMAEKAGMGDLAEVFATAGELHDAGKGDPIWQAAVGGSVDDPLAKPKKQFAPGRLGGFRHEFSSLRRLEADAVDELALHLIASHHGWARPFFRPQAYDRRAVRESQRTAMECARRFGRLQEGWGAWRLAHLEAIFKAADGWVSEMERQEGQAKEQPDYA